MGDGGGSDAGIDTSPPGPVVYSSGARHSPVTAELAEGLRAIAGREPGAADDVFAKVGDSITVSTSFMHCFAGSAVDLDGRDLAATHTHFLGGVAGTTTPYDRDSQAAEVGRTASWIVSGDPSPLSTEIAAISPRYALVMVGTNDVGFVNTLTYAERYLDLVDGLLDRGVVPTLSSIPPRDDSVDADARVPLFNLVARGVAQGRQIPFVDYHAELVPLPDHGLGGDGVHPRRSSLGACVLTAEGLNAGYNVRNLISLEALDRMRRVVSGGEPQHDADAPTLSGAGTIASPVEIDALPFTDIRSTLFSESDAFALYDGCMADQDESGPEVVYRLEVTAPTTLVARVVDRGTVDVDVHLLDDSGTAGGCIARDHESLTASIDTGTYYLVLDTFVSSGGVENAGEYFVLVTEQ